MPSACNICPPPASSPNHAVVTIPTNFASNNAAAVVGTPTAFSFAQQLGILVARLSATQVAYQTDMLIISAGEHEFRDYTRIGVPLRS